MGECEITLLPRVLGDRWCIFKFCMKVFLTRLQYDTVSVVSKQINKQCLNSMVTGMIGLLDTNQHMVKWVFLRKVRFGKITRFG